MRRSQWKACRPAFLDGDVTRGARLSMESVHVIAGLDPTDGGPAYSVPSLCAALGRAGWTAPILTVRSERCNDRPGLRTFPQIAAKIPVLGALRLAPELRRASFEMARHASVVHTHGLWLMPNVDAGLAARRAERPLVVSPRGMVARAALRFSSLRKRLFWLLLQRGAYAHAAAWHATSAREAEDIRAFGIAAPIAVIPNGVDLPEQKALHDAEAPRRRLLCLSRLHPMKSLPVLLQAWEVLATERPDWDLIIAGDDVGGHRVQLEAQVVANAIPRVTFAGPTYGAAKDAMLRSADLFALPTRSENFGIVVAEALAMGVPVVVTTGTPWAGLANERCGWWIEHGAEPLLGALREATALPPTERGAMGLRGREWMARDFAWNAIGAQMAAVYDWLARGAPRPATVRLD